MLPTPSVEHHVGFRGDTTDGPGGLGAALAYASNRFKEIARRLMPAHHRFVRAGESFLARGEREVHELPVLVEPGSTVVDVGAHIGDYTYSLCRHVGPAGRVIAIEPVPDLARMLARATRRLRWPVTVLNCALSSRTGAAELRVPFQNGERMAGFATLEPRTVEGRSHRVTLARLDDVCRDVRGRLSFIKIDVEGHELEVLRGGTATILHHRPNLLIEIEQRHSPVPVGETFAFVTSLGYRGHFLVAGERLHLDSFDVVEHQSPPAWSGGAAPRPYVSNFIFRPA